MRLTNKLFFLPGHCTLCRSGNRELYVDTNADFDYEGHVAICNLCVMEMADLLAYSPVVNIPANLPGALEETRDLLRTLEKAFQDEFTVANRQLSILATSIERMAKLSEQHFEQQTIERSADDSVQADKGTDPKSGGKGLDSTASNRAAAADFSFNKS